jgi:glycosyltransferase involved in cell wall biosynthesis
MMTDSPLRIAFCITELDPGGAERAMVEVVTRLDRTQFAPKVFCLGPRGRLADELEAVRIPVTCFGANGLWNFGVGIRLRRALRQFRPAILQTWLFHANLLGRLAGRFAGVPVIVSGIRVAERRSRWRLWAERVTQSLVDAHVCVSRDVAEFSVHRGGLNASRIRIIPNGVDASRFNEAQPADLSGLKISADAKVILFVGRLDPQKDPLFLLDTFPIVRSAIPKLHLVYVGDGDLRSPLTEEIASRELSGCVHVLGWRADVPGWLKAADVLVLCSRWEGMPNVILEAFAAGTPVVAVPVEGVSELITDRETGLLVATRDRDELAAAILTILQDAEVRTHMVISSQHLVREKFTWEATVEGYVALYQELLENRGRSGRKST